MATILQRIGRKHDAFVTFFRIVFLLFVFPARVMSETAPPSSQKHPDTVIIIASKGDLFNEAKNGLVNDLENEFQFFSVETDDRNTRKNIEVFFTGKEMPKAVVLIGNKSIRYYKEFAEFHKEETKYIQVITIMALGIKHAADGIPNVQGIAYETPMVTAIVKFRRVINKPFTTVGVLYREPFSDFIRNNTEYCRKEHVTVKSVLIDDNIKRHGKEISKGLKFLLNREKIQVLWIPNDNILLKPKLLVDVWLPFLNESNIPVIVGVESLVKPKLGFGTYAVIPDAKAIGEQAADVLIDLKENGWNHTGIKIYPAISMYSVLNLEKALKIADKKDLRIDEITKILTRENDK